MLISEYVEMKWNSKNKNYYESLGYHYTKMKDSFMVKTQDLKKGSNVRVKVKCDYCGELYDVAWYSYVILKKKENSKDCCSNPDCTTKKSHESLLSKYDTTVIREIDGVNDKIRETNLRLYGYENPFSNKEIQEQIKKTNLKKYGCEVPTQNKEVYQKVIDTCMEKYGVPCYLNINYSGDNIRGENSPVWKGGLAIQRDERSTYDYRIWRKSVYNRDNYTCQCCGARNGNGKYIELQAHHIKNWKDNIEDRYDISNGITLCTHCHMRFHSIYGKHNNNEKQLNEFLNNNIDKKIC